MEGEASRVADASGAGTVRWNRFLR